MLRKKESGSSEPCMPAPTPSCPPPPRPVPSVAFITVVGHVGKTNSHPKSLRESRDIQGVTTDSVAKNRELMCTLQRYWKKCCIGSTKKQMRPSKGNASTRRWWIFPRIWPSPPPGQESKARQIPFLFSLEGAIQLVAGLSSGSSADSATWEVCSAPPVWYLGPCHPFNISPLFCCLLSPQLWPLGDRDIW